MNTRDLTRWLPRLACASLVLAALCPAAGATEEDMAKLPLVEPFACLICHDSAEPQPASFALNDFGDDFLANARQWDADLANLDSDGDQCLNGVELGDTDADGEADGNVDVLQSNPGNGTDCGVNTVDPTTWTELKSLFDRK